jgi:hypothetical protein
LPASMALPGASRCSSIGIGLYWQLGSYSVSPSRMSGRKVGMATTSLFRLLLCSEFHINILVALFYVISQGWGRFGVFSAG